MSSINQHPEIFHALREFREATKCPLTNFLRKLEFVSTEIGPSLYSNNPWVKIPSTLVGKIPTKNFYSNIQVNSVVLTIGVCAWPSLSRKILKEMYPTDSSIRDEHLYPKVLRSFGRAFLTTQVVKRDESGKIDEEENLLVMRLSSKISVYSSERFNDSTLKKLLHLLKSECVGLKRVYVVINAVKKIQMMSFENDFSSPKNLEELVPEGLHVDWHIEGYGDRYFDRKTIYDQSFWNYKIDKDSVYYRYGVELGENNETLLLKPEEDSFMNYYKILENVHKKVINSNNPFREFGEYTIVDELNTIAGFFYPEYSSDLNEEEIFHTILLQFVNGKIKNKWNYIARILGSRLLICFLKEYAISDSENVKFTVKNFDEFHYHDETEEKICETSLHLF